MRALFAEKDAFVFTTWSGGVPIDEFIKVSGANPPSCLIAEEVRVLPLQISEIGFSKGVKIAHRVNGGTVDIAVSGPYAGKRALGKLKA